MKPWQKYVRVGAIAFALVLIITISVHLLSIIGLITGLSSADVLDEAKSYEFGSDIRILELDISAAAVKIAEYDGDKIKVVSNLKDFKTDEDGDTLKLKDRVKKFSLGANYEDINGAFIEISYPSGTEFDKIVINGGAGVLEIDGLKTDLLDLDLGAGETAIRRLEVTASGDIEGGAGALSFEDCTLNDIDLDMGVGELEFKGFLGGKCDISLGVGKADFELVGALDDYEIRVDKGIGAIYIDGESRGNGEYGSGDNKLDIDGGIGEINIRFASEK